MDEKERRRKCMIAVSEKVRTDAEIAVRKAKVDVLMGEIADLAIKSRYFRELHRRLARGESESDFCEWDALFANAG